MTATPTLKHQVAEAVCALRAGGVIAYPTEYCFGLGCDPRNDAAIQRLLQIKQRTKEQGVILIAANFDQVRAYADLDCLKRAIQIKQSWPGPNTWLLPANDSVSPWVRGRHTTLAMRIPDHSVCQALCSDFGHAVISTSANRHGQDALLSYTSVLHEFEQELDYIINAEVGGAKAASTIRHALTGEQLR